MPSAHPHSALPFADPLLFQVFEELPLGVIVLDEAGKVVVYNRHEEQLANRKREQVLGRDFFHEVAPCMNVKELGGEFFRRIGREPLSLRIEFSFPFPFLDQPRDVMVRLSSLAVEGRPFGYLLIEDVSTQRAVERMKETLSQLLVHDLKNPLAVVLGNFEIIKTQLPEGSDPMITDSVSDGIAATRRLEKMVMNLLDITRLETGSFPLRRAPTDVAELVRQVAAESQALGRMRRVEVVSDLPKGPVTASVDTDVLRRALDNLVENAVRYAPVRGRVVVRAAADPEAVVLEVEDNGPGVPEAMREHIFDKYQQLESAGRTPLNRGLGLTFVRLAARAHGGDARVDSPGGKGTVFRLTLPTTATAPVEVRA